MAYTETYINNDMSKLKTVLDTLVTNGIAGAVDKDDTGTYPVFKLYVDAEKTQEFFRITQAQGQDSGTVKYTAKATCSDGNYLTATGAVASANSHIHGYTILYGYSCENGVFLQVQMNGGQGFTAIGYCIIITKNQEDSPVVIFSNNTVTGVSYDPPPADQIKTNLNTEHIVAYTDKAPLSTLSRTAPAARGQTVLSPFFSCPETGSASYTPYAGRVLAGGLASLVTDARLTEITFGSGTWITNGYWALKVE